MKWRLAATILVTVLSGCKSPPKVDNASPSSATVEPSVQRVAAPDVGLLVEQVQLLRDREFAKRPTVRADKAYKPEARCTDACRNDREALVDVLFGSDIADAERRAHFDRATNAVVYDASIADAAERDFAIASALVEGLDRQTGAPLPAAQSWDAFLAREALVQGPGTFIAALKAGRKLSDRLSAEVLANHPELLPQLAPRSVVESFAAREGFALTAAMLRSGGWSAVELLRNEPPAGTFSVVRPDRYLEAADYGTWELPEALLNQRAADGWKLEQTGHVGPAVFVKWLSRHVDPRIARAAYLGLESDAYRTWTRGETRSLEWVSLWNTPNTAQQIVAVIEAGLRAQNGQRIFSVLRQGATVAVVSSESKDDGLEAARLLLGSRPRFLPGESIGLAFRPTPIDVLTTRALEAELDGTRWSDPATQLSVDLAPLTAWKTQKTDEWHIRWFAKHADGSLLELTTEVASPLAPDAGTREFEELLSAAFRNSVKTEGDVTVKRVDLPTSRTVQIDLTGTTDANARRAFRVWNFSSGPYLVTVSLQAEPSVFEARLAEVEPVVQAIEVPAADEAQAPSGTISFTVEGE